MTKFPLIAALYLIAHSMGAAAQTADELVKKHVDAMGGLDNWKKVNTTLITGNLNLGGKEFPVSITTLNKKGYRLEFTINGMSNYTIVTPDNGWMYMPIQGQTKAEAMPAEEVKQEQDNLDVAMDALIDYKAKGNKVTYLGKDEVEGTECYKLKVTHSTGKEETDFLDVGTYYCIRTVEKTTANGKEEESISNLSNFQKLPEGVVFPMSIESDGAPITLKTIEINKPVDESIFKPNEVKK